VSSLIEDASGDLLSASVDALVNPVNTVGVMGKGLARGGSPTTSPRIELPM
jgi:O-acetyl-ADP-ribose deacetylase (regulator of RNase III)